MDNEASNPENKGIQKTSFWNFLKELDKIEIPIIQRDYAQGREGEEYSKLRGRFIENLKRAMDSGEQLKLDFIYGSEIVYDDEKNGKKKKVKILQPLDGQQRLTTLWLLHWYIALRAGQLTKENCEVLGRFAYETRISSREFCQSLCRPEYFTSFTGGKIVDFIENQIWFYSVWKQEPTIQSMLRMLGGTKTDDGIECVFNDIEDYGQCWYDLTSLSSGVPIVFYYTPLKNFGLSDDLYIKMNARGKQITPFENFKADLITYLRKEENIELYESISAKLDNIWTDIFWENKSDENKIDEIYFAFLNRFFWNEFFIARKEKRSDDEGPYRFHINEYESEPKVPYPYVLRVGKGTFRDDNGKEVETGTIENHNSSYAYLEGSEKGEVEYSDLEPYKFLHKGIPITLFKNLQKVLDNYSKYKDRYKKILGNSDSGILSRRIEDFKFIPEYKDETSITKVDNKAQRVIFFALCKYFYEYKEEENKEEENKEEENMLRWLRLVCKLTGKNEGGNAIVDSNLDARGAIRYLALLDSQNVLESLFAQSTVKADSALKRQWNEEVIKAKQILSEDGKTPRKYNGTLLKGKDGSKYKTWEEVIMDAEEYAFFDGTIRFLYQGEDGEDGEKDWDNFNKKWENAQKYFLEKPDTRQDKEIWVENNSADLLKALISLISSDDFESVLLNSQSINNWDDSWMYYLLNRNICANIHQLLTLEVKDGRIPIKPRSYSRSFNEEAYEHTLYYLSQTQLLDMLVKVIPYSWIRREDGSLVIRDKHSWKSSGQYVHLNTNKYDFLENVDVTKVEESNKIEGTKFHFENSKICFEYKSLPYIRWSDRWIYLQNKSGLPMSDEKDTYHMVRNPAAPVDSSERWYCFDTKGLNEAQIMEKLDNLKSDYENDMSKKGKADPPSNS